MELRGKLQSLAKSGLFVVEYILRAKTLVNH